MEVMGSLAHRYCLLCCCVLQLFTILCDTLYCTVTLHYMVLHCITLCSLHCVTLCCHSAYQVTSCTSHSPGVLLDHHLLADLVDPTQEMQQFTKPPIVKLSNGLHPPLGIHTPLPWHSPPLTLSPLLPTLPGSPGSPSLPGGPSLPVKPAGPCTPVRPYQREEQEQRMMQAVSKIVFMSSTDVQMLFADSTTLHSVTWIVLNCICEWFK